MSSSSRRVDVSTCRRPIGCGGAPGSVTSTRSRSSWDSSSWRASSPARSRSSASRAWRASFAALPTAPRCAGSSSATRAAPAAARLAAEVADAQVLELLARAGPRSPPRPGPAAARSARSSAVTVLPREPRARPRGHLIQRHRRGHGRVERLRGDRYAHRPLAGRDERGGQPSRSAPTSSVIACASPRAGRRRTSDASASRRCALPAARQIVDAASGTANTAPMLARTAFGEKGSAQSRPSATTTRRTPAPNAVSCRRCPVANAVQVDAQRAQRRAPALLVDADHARPEPSVDTPASTPGSTS